MATAASPQQPVTADDVLTMQFTLIKKGGYDSQEVDAFLDRVAATLDRHQGHLVPGAMTADDVRSVEFTLVKRGGYATREVDDFLDRVVAVLSGVPVDTSAPAAPAPVESGDVFSDLDLDLDMDLDMGAESEPEPRSAAVFDEDEIFEAPIAADLVVEPPVEHVAPVADPPPPVRSSAEPQLHDPEGAAQRLLAAAQQAADSLTADAKTFADTARRDADQYASATRSEADDYAQATRSEADEHAERVTTTAEAQAASIREVAADEARRVAEEARTRLVDEMESLENRKADLERAVEELEAVVGAERSRLLDILDDLRDRVAGELPMGSGSGVSSPGHAASGAATSAASDDRDDRGDNEDLERPDDAFLAAESHDVDHDATAALDMSDVSLDVGADADFDSAADVDLDDEDELIASASRSVFDLDETDHEDDTSADWLDDAPAEEAIAAPVEESTTANGTGGLFDIEAEDDWQEEAPPAPSTDPAPTGDSFFDELRQAEDDDGLGPLDDDTDAALSAFFEADDDTSDAKWRDRFGPGRN